MAGSSQVARLDKGHLRAARVLGQVDRKFIACVVDPDSSENSLDEDTTLGSSLLLVDQHAADERVRVERFQRDLCTGFLKSETEQRKLQPPVAVLLTAREVEQITSSTDLLDIMKRWGFTFSNNTTGCSTINVANPKADYLQVLVDGIPALLANKVIISCKSNDFPVNLNRSSYSWKTNYETYSKASCILLQKSEIYHSRHSSPHPCRTNHPGKQQCDGVRKRYSTYWIRRPAEVRYRIDFQRTAYV